MSLSRAVYSDGDVPDSRYSSANPMQEPPKARRHKKKREIISSHTAYRCRWFEFHPGRLCAIDGLPSYSGVASGSDGRAYKKNQSLTLAVASHLSESSGGDTPAPSQKNRMLAQRESMNDKEYMLRQLRVKGSLL